MSKFIQIKMIFHFICLFIAFQSITSVSGRLDSLLARLYNKAQSSHRPLIVILDNSYLKKSVLQPAHKPINPLITSSGEIRHVEAQEFLKLTGRPRMSTIPPSKRPVKHRNKFRALDDAQSPIVKSLLRISNDLRCDAKDDCVDECEVKFSGVKKRKCVFTCQITFECKQESDSCKGDECYPNSCQSDSCEPQQGSTKGYVMSSEKKCYKGRC
ncbi:uncharacterized protein LOC123720168 [Pieris brassicae]|uniref:uncharacterized protein LOC123720168 n=1 Tax=Pieris brassicae TaxID=7116 RepID=UPI001E65F1E7|nr:uncharacterized protein LOC123720168 [Pieris brassicae]